MPLSEANIKNMDHLGLVAGMIDELEIVESVDAVIDSSSPSRNLSVGESVKAMILNGLGYVNKPLYLTPSFFKDKPVERLFGRMVKAEWFNDDTLGRAMDRLFAYGVSELYEKIAAKALKKLGLTPSTVHLDSTSFHLDGVYANRQEDENSDTDEEDETSQPVRITQGYSRDHHPELNQVVLNLIVEHQAGIPVRMQPGDGNQIDTQAFKSIVEEHVVSLKKAYDTPVKVIGDAALFTVEGIEKIKTNELLFISRVPARLKEAKAILGKYDPRASKRLDDNYRFIAYEIEYQGMPMRWMLYQSIHAKTKQTATLRKELAKQGDEELKRLKKLMKQRFFCQADAKAALEETKAKLQTTEIIDAKIAEIPKYAKKGRPKPGARPQRIEYGWRLTLASGQDALIQKMQSSGLFILATNDMNLDPKELLDEYKSQQRVERGFRFLKSPEFLADAFFLKKPERIEAMLMIMTLSLLVYSALEYTIRQRLKKQNMTFPDQKGKPTDNPTARWVFQNFFAIHLLRLNEEEQMIGLNEKHRVILDILGPRYGRFYGFNEASLQ